MRRILTSALVSILLLISSPAFAVVENFCGWEAGANGIENTTSSGTQSTQSTTKRTGNYALRVNPTTTATGFHVVPLIESNGTNGDGSPAIGCNVWVRFYFRYATKPSSGDEQIFAVYNGSSTTIVGSIRINSDGTLDLVDFTPTVVGTSSTALSQDTWYRVEAHFVCNATPATWELKINGTTEVSASGVGDGASIGRTVLGKVVNLNGNTVDFFYDDYMVSDSAFPGDGQVVCMNPDANGSTMQWTSGTGASDYTQVDDIPFESAAYVMTTSTAGDVALFDFESASSAGVSGTIKAVKAVYRARENTSVTSATSIRVRSNTTNSDSSSFDHTTTNATQSRLLETDPDTAAAWTTGGLDGIEAGGVEANAVATRMNDICVMVDFVPAAAGRRRVIVS